MRTSLYSLSILLFRLALPLLANFSDKLKLFYQGRKNLINNIKTDLASNENKLFWVHCSSVGEFEQGLPVIELIKKLNPTWKVVVTFFSPSGYEAVTNKNIDFKFYLPLDSSLNASQFLDVVKPQMALFIKYEYWYHFLVELKARAIPIFSVSSIFRPTQTFFKWWGSWNRKMLSQFTYFMVQDESSSELLNSIGIKNATVTGDTRFDRVLKIKNEIVSFPEIGNFKGDEAIFIIGSLRPEDDELIINLINSNANFKYIIAPHEITEKHLRKIENSIPSTIRHSKLASNSDKKVLIIDSIGKLSRLYRFANYAFIGGGFSDGIHNILEPAVYNIPVFFGNKYFKKYKEANDLVAADAAFPVSSAQDINNKLDFFEDPTQLSIVRDRIEEYVKSNTGSAEKVVSIINQQTNR